MKKFYNGFTAVNNALKKFELHAGAISLGVLFVVMIVNAALRYLFMSGLDFSDELNGFLFVWMGFLGASLVMANEGHLRVTALVDILPKAVQYVISVIMNIIMIIMIAIYMKPLVRLLATLPISNVMRIPLKYVYVILPVAFIFMLIHLVYNIMSDTMEFIETRKNRKGDEA